MKRITLLGSGKNTTPGLPWKAQVANAVVERDHDKLLTLLDHDGGRERLREGFSYDSLYGVPFALLCMRHGALDMLCKVVDTAPDGITMADTKVSHVIEAAQGRKAAFETYSEMSLHEEAIAAEPSPELLAIALKYEPDSSAITAHLDRFSGATLHHHALYRVCTTFEAERAQKLIDCCRQLISAGAPVAHRTEGTVGLGEMLFTYRWDKRHISSEVVPLIGDYVRAGYVKLNEPAALGAHLPVIQAILAGNGYAAAAAIDLGCDVDLAVSSFKLAGHSCLLDIAHSSIEAPDCIDETVALVTEALMRRKVADSHAPAAPADHRIHRRAARAAV